MNLLLKFLIYHLETIDGKRYSARPVLAGLMGNSKLSPGDQMELRKQHEYHLYNKILTRYKVIRIRGKLSYIALKRC